MQWGLTEDLLLVAAMDILTIITWLIMWATDKQQLKRKS
jgi:hypothetical protein